MGPEGESKGIYLISLNQNIGTLFRGLFIVEFSVSSDLVLKYRMNRKQ